jgi:hypothetical protein
MSVHVPSVFLLACVGSVLATGLITRPKSPRDCKIHSSRLILMGNRPEGLMKKEKEKEKEKEKKKKEKTSSSIV